MSGSSKRIGGWSFWRITGPLFSLGLVLFSLPAQLLSLAASDMLRPGLSFPFFFSSQRHAFFQLSSQLLSVSGLYYNFAIF